MTNARPRIFTIRDAAGTVLFSEYARDGEHAMDCMFAIRGIEFNAPAGMTIEATGTPEERWHAED